MLGFQRAQDFRTWTAERKLPEREWERRREEAVAGLRA